jgi:hypothetical protein
MERGDILIYYIIPEYIDNIGDCCRFKNDKYERIYEKKIDSVLKEVFKEKCIDINAVKYKCSRVLNQRNLIPLFLSKDEILVPVKSRIPRFSRDGGYGYINALLIKKVEDEHIVLKDGSKILYIDNKRSFSKRLKMVKTLEDSMTSNSPSLEHLGSNLKSNSKRKILH